MSIFLTLKSHFEHAACILTGKPDNIQHLYNNIQDMRAILKERRESIATQIPEWAWKTERIEAVSEVELLRVAMDILKQRAVTEGCVFRDDAESDQSLTGLALSFFSAFHTPLQCRFWYHETQRMIRTPDRGMGLVLLDHMLLHPEMTKKNIACMKKLFLEDVLTYRNSLADPEKKAGDKLMKDMAGFIRLNRLILK